MGHSIRKPAQLTTRCSGIPTTDSYGRKTVRSKCKQNVSIEPKLLSFYCHQQCRSRTRKDVEIYPVSAFDIFQTNLLGAVFLAHTLLKMW